MVSLRRFGLPLVVFLLALTAVAARLWDVQVGENQVWAQEAANLMRSWRVEPYLRGTITDRDGRVWVRDEEVYELELVWRDFRRGHPLGQVAQVRSLVEVRSVPLREVHSDLAATALDLVHLSPSEIDAFGEGDFLRLGEVFVPAVPGETVSQRRQNARTRRRASRASELHWYVTAMLSPSRRERRAIRDAKGTDAWSEAYIDIVAEARGVEVRVFADELRARLDDSLVRLAELGGEALDLTGGEDGLGSPFDRLISLLEDKRRSVEFAAADDLFREAAGFAPGRLDHDNLAAIDLEWLRRALYWDDARLAEWVNERGHAFTDEVRRTLAGHVIARAKVAQEWERPGDQILSSLASLFASDSPTQSGSALPHEWWDLDEIAVLDRFDRRFERTGTLPDALFRGGLPFQAANLRDLREAGASEQEVVQAAIASVPGLPDSGRPGVSPVAYTAHHLVEVARQPYPTWRRHHQDAVEAVLLHWGEEFQSRVRTLFAGLPGGVALREAEVEEALATKSYIIRDRESRPLRFSRTPSYEVVHLVTRYPDRYAGFHVRSSTRRMPIALVEGDEEGRMVGEFLIGRTRTPYMVDVFRQRPDEARLRAAQRELDQDEETRAWIYETVQGLRSTQVAMGASGIEGYFEQELSGKNGYREHLGLQEREEGREPVHIPAIDGRDLTLTLHLPLQAEWERVLNSPAPPPPDEEKPDRAWHASPVGAVMLMTVDGEVIVSASSPLVPDDERRYHQDGQRTVAVDRSLRMLRGQPPGSVFKPFVALWALESGKITPHTPFECCQQPGDPSPFGSHKPGGLSGGKVHCLSSGHGALADGGVTLDLALRKSCNAYFAGLGEWIDRPGFRDVCDSFGFHGATGVRIFGNRLGLVEDTRASELFDPRRKAVLTAPMRQRFANGLSHMNASVAQVGRAYAGLATGRLPELTFVRAIGDEVLEPRTERMPFAQAHLESVRSALAQVVESGTAQGKGLDAKSLGYTLACKTGSADYNTTTGKVPEDPMAPLGRTPWVDGDRKHGWLAGWFPVEDPKFVVVVYCHDTSTTSSHIATHITRQLLTAPETAAWIQEELK